MFAMVNIGLADEISPAGTRRPRAAASVPCRKFQPNKEKKRVSRTWFRKQSGLENDCQGKSYFIFLFLLFYI
jgi:hypothetical protein